MVIVTWSYKDYVPSMRLMQSSLIVASNVSFDNCRVGSNYAIKGTSVHTLDSSELPSGASVPYFGC
jgi:hypothetical protein